MHWPLHPGGGLPIRASSLSVLGTLKKRGERHQGERWSDNQPQLESRCVWECVETWKDCLDATPGSLASCCVAIYQTDASMPVQMWKLQ